MLLRLLTALARSTTPPLRLVGGAAGIPARGLYTAVFLIMMNKEVYESLPEEERKVIDAHAGAGLSAELSRIWDAIEAIGRDAFAAAGGEVTFVKGGDYDAWVQASEHR